MARAPLTVDVLRGREVESRHLVDAVIVDADGSVVDAWGDTDRLVMPRSAAKPIQALPLVESGAAAHFQLDDIELALACASHNGEEAQVDRVVAWLNRVGSTPADLECGPQMPSFEPAAVTLMTSGRKPGPEHNNCSGKHSGFLTLCLYFELPTEGYIGPDHPLQANHVTPALSEICAVDLVGQAPGIDGCGIPVWNVPMTNLAMGWARLTKPGAGRKLLEAMMAEPYFVAGTDRSSTDIMSKTVRPAAVKGGAEGVFCGAVIDDGIGIALKVRDGAGRAAGVAIEHILDTLGVVTEGAHRLTNWAGTEVGELLVCENDGVAAR